MLQTDQPRSAGLGAAEVEGTTDGAIAADAHLHDRRLDVDLWTGRVESSNDLAEAEKVNVDIEAPTGAADFNTKINLLIQAVIAKKGRLAKVKSGRRARLDTAAENLRDIRDAVRTLRHYISTRDELD